MHDVEVAFNDEVDQLEQVLGLQISYPRIYDGKRMANLLDPSRTGDQGERGEVIDVVPCSFQIALYAGLLGLNVVLESGMHLACGGIGLERRRKENDRLPNLVQISFDYPAIGCMN